MDRFMNKLSTGTALRALAVIAVTLPSLASANPTGGVVVNPADATIDNSVANLVTINQSANKAIINWATFNIGAGETTQFAQPSADAITLNRIGDANPSSILGTINANGRIMLINRNGMTFGGGSQVNVGSLIATTADITNARFNADNFAFAAAGNTNAAITLDGTINVNEALAVVAPTVNNNGTINANGARVALHGGDVFTLDVDGDQLVNYALPVGVARTGSAANAATVNNPGNIYADGGTIQLTARASKAVVNAAVNMSGIAEAHNINLENGKITLEADNVTVDGVLDAQGKSGGNNGGDISVRARKTLNFTGDALAAGNGAGTDGGTVSLRGSTVNLGGEIAISSGDEDGTAGTATIRAGGTLNIRTNEANTIASAMSGGGTVNVGADKNIILYEDIDMSGQANMAQLHIFDANADNLLNANIHRKIKLGANQTLTGEATKITIHENASLQNANDMAADNAAVKVYAGFYDEDLDITKAGVVFTGTNANIAGTGVRNLEAEINGYVNIDHSANGAIFKGFTVYGNDFDGIFTGIVGRGDNIQITNNIVDGCSVCAEVGISLNTAQNAVVRGNLIGGFANGMVIKNSNNVNIRDNMIFAEDNGIQARNADYANIQGNSIVGGGIFFDTGLSGVELNDSNYTFVRNNQIANFDTGILSKNTDYGNIRDNDLMGVHDGIVLKNAYRGFIKNNYIEGLGVDDLGSGITVTRSDRTRVFTNRIAEFQNGIKINHSEDVNINRNRIEEVRNGVNANFADGLIVTGNQLDGDGAPSSNGIWVRNSDNVDILNNGNTFTDFGRAVRLAKTTNVF